MIAIETIALIIYVIFSSILKSILKVIKKSFNFIKNYECNRIKLKSYYILFL